MSQLRMGKKTKKKPNELLLAATTYFGPTGLGLKIIPREENVILFTNDSAFVQISAEPTASGTEIDIQSRELSYDVKRFLRRL
ncbi:MAG: hypothetical protein WAS33_27300 [Candidatus Promineifilaceae bacterium]|nr:hypothetical protein [Anaerolineaceae bacterium]